MAAPDTVARWTDGADPGQMPGWPTGPDRPHLPDDVVHVWICDLDASPDVLLDSLSADERARARGILREPARARWAHSRAILRSLSGAYLDEDPARVRLRLGPHDRPELCRDGWAPSFSVSHSGPIALIAFASAGPVGVDIELDRPGIDVERLAPRILRPDARAGLGPLSPTERRRELLRAWVAREARGKCLGTGLAAAPSRTAPSVVELALGASATGALATTSPSRAIERWRWPGRHASGTGGTQRAARRSSR